MKYINSKRKSSFAGRLLIGTAISGLAVASAHAQQGGGNVETVVVTGTSIRGAQPTGSNLITMDRATIENTGAQSVQAILTEIPTLANFQGLPQGTQNVPVALGIHSVGSGSASATLVLIDGHRFPGQGVGESDPDPNLIPAIALQRVEVLPDGASAIYGSDAVSGVINFVTRRDFTGFESNIQTSFADKYSSTDGSVLLGHAWDGGSVMLAYDYSSQSNLMNSSRSFITARQDIRRGAADPSMFTGITPTPPNSNGTASTQGQTGTNTVAGVTYIAPMTVTPAAGPGTTAPGGVAIPFPSAGVNFQTFFCPVATIAGSSSGGAFYYQPGGGYGGPAFYTSTTNLPSQGACDNVAVTTSLPSVTANSAMVQFRQELTPSVSFDLEAIYGSHAAIDHVSRGTVQATVFGPTAAAGAGSNATTVAAAAAGEVNPFYVGNPSNLDAAHTGTASELIRYDFNALLGPGATTKSSQANIFTTMGLTWDLGNDREIVVGSTFGMNTIANHTSGVVSQPEALLALNGTANTAGTPGLNAQPDVFANSTNSVVSRILTTLNALDVWDPAGPTNKTSASIIASLKDGGNIGNANQGLQDVSVKFDGPIFDLPAGALKASIGTEFLHAYFDEYGSRTTNAGPSLSNSTAFYYRNGRQIYSAFAEINAPVVSAEMHVPLIQSLTLDMSGRFDEYSDVGDTMNPKVGVDWVVTDGLKVRAAWGTAFVAANLHDSNPFNAQSQIGALTGQFANPIIPFNDTRPFNGGAGIAGTWVSTAASCAAGFGTPVNSAGKTVAATDPTAVGCLTNFGATNAAGSSSAGITVPGGNGNLSPAKSHNWSIGLDTDYGKLIGIDGLTSNLTFWSITYTGLITSGGRDALPQLTYFAPIGGWTPSSPAIQTFIAGRVVNTPLQATTWAFFDGRLQNAFDIWVNGLDFSVNYGFQTDSMGSFKFGLNGTQLLRQSQRGGKTGPILDVKDGKNSGRYPSEEMQARATVNWSFDAISAQLSANYLHPQSISLTNYPYNFPGPDRGFLQGSPAAVPTGGQGHLGALFTMDLNVNYTVPSGFAGLPDLVSNGASVSLTVKNLLDAAPPFLASNSGGAVSGFNQSIGSPVGRTVTVGIRKAW